AIGGGYLLAKAYVEGWATRDFSAVSAHIVAAGRDGDREVVDALHRHRAVRQSEPLRDRQFEGLLAAALPKFSPPIDPYPRVPLALIGKLPSGRLLLLDIGLGDPKCQRHWSAIIARVRSRGLSIVPVIGPPQPAVIRAMEDVYAVKRRAS